MDKIEWLKSYNDLSADDKMDVDAYIAMGLSDEPCGLVTPSYVARAIPRATAKAIYNARTK